MIFKNFKKLATTKSRRDALEIVNAGLEEVLIKNSMSKQIRISGNKLSIQGKVWNLSNYKRIFVIGAGKAAADMALSLEKILGNRIDNGIVIDTRNADLKHIKVVKGTHPLPSEINRNATREIVGILQSCTCDDLVINLISGGGSALLFYPRVEVEKQIEVTKMLLKRGAAIQEINTVRKHISYVKGGQLAALCSESDMITLIISDVISNKLEIIASGPTVLDTSTISDAKRIARKYRLPELPFVETPKVKPKNVTNILLITNIPAAKAMAHKAKQLGYKVKMLGTQVHGEARVVGKRLAGMIKPGVAIIGAGETTVTVTGKGKGGRNQELAMAAASYIQNGVVASSSSDGVDFITDAAGGITDQYTNVKAENLNLDVSKFLNNNNSYNFLNKVNGILITGKTGTNVGDLLLALGDKK